MSNPCHGHVVGESKTCWFSAPGDPYKSPLELKEHEWLLLISQLGEVWAGEGTCLAQGNPTSQSAGKRWWLKLWEEVTSEEGSRKAWGMVWKEEWGKPMKVHPKPRVLSTLPPNPHFLMICFLWCLAIYSEREDCKEVEWELRASGIPGSLQIGEDVDQCCSHGQKLPVWGKAPKGGTMK